ncbi:MAG TPA: amidohydrolase family protein [Aridibacter sp.]|nr:amidohydrolase family protein [Aridibacter sp.]
MRSLSIPVIIIVTALFGISCGDQRVEQKEAADLAITGAIVVHPDSEKAPKVEDIVVREGKIVAVGPGVAKRYDPKQIYDARGKFIIPGLADMHSHFGNGILEPEADDTKQVLARHLYFGNTTILNLGSSQAWPTRIDALRSDLGSGKIQGPRLLAVGSLMTIPGSHPVATISSPPVQKKIEEIVSKDDGEGPIDLAPFRAITLVRDADDVTEEVRRVAEWGADAIKLTVESGPGRFGDDHPQMSPEMIRAAADAAKPYGIPVLCHVSSMDELEACLGNGANGIVHGVTDDRDQFPDDLEAGMKEEGFVEIPTAAMFDGWYRYTKDPSLLDSEYLKPVLSEGELGWLKSPGMIESFSIDDDWADENIGRLGRHLKKFGDSGGTIVAGTDTGNPYRIAGFALHEEIAFYVKHGLTPKEALKTATVNAARLVGDENEWGRIRNGLAADLVILNRNPLEDIANTLSIAEVIKAGKLVDRSSLPLR